MKAKHGEQTRDIWDTLDRVRSIVGGDEDWADLLGVGPGEESRMKRDGRGPPLQAVENLADELDLSVQGIISGSLDFNALERRFRGEHDRLPERYAVGALSRRRTSAHLLSWYETRHGWTALNRFFAQTGLTASHFADREKLINIRVLEDFCRFLLENGYTIPDLYRLGMYSVVDNAGGPVAQRFLACRNYSEIYELLVFELVQEFYDRNCDYRLVSTAPGESRLRFTPSEEIVSLLDDPRPGSFAACTAKAGTAASMPGYLGLPYARVEHVRCMYAGDAYCEYSISYPACSRADASGIK